MIHVEPLTVHHLRAISIQPAQASQFLLPMLNDENIAAWLTSIESYSAIDGDRVIACAGVFPLWPNVARVWAMLSCPIGGAHMLALHRACKRGLELRPEHRIEADVATDFEQGHRWLRMFGFVNEGTMRAYAPDGRDYDRYARVRHG